MTLVWKVGEVRVVWVLMTKTSHEEQQEPYPLLDHAAARLKLNSHELQFTFIVHTDREYNRIALLLNDVV